MYKVKIRNVVESTSLTSIQWTNSTIHCANSGVLIIEFLDPKLKSVETEVSGLDK